MTQPTSSCGRSSSPASPLAGGKPPPFWAVLKPLALVAVLLAPINASAETDSDYEAAKAETLRLAGITAPAGTEAEDTKVSSDTAPAWWPWKVGSELEKPPAVKPYQIPTMAGDGLDYHDKPAAIVQAPALDADAIFKAVLACYPERSKFDIDVDLRAAIRSSDVLDLQDTATAYAELNTKLSSGKHPLASLLRQRLHALLGAGFASHTPWTQWTRLPIYLKAMTLRIDKYSGNPSRDAAREADIQALEQMWQEKTNALQKQNQPLSDGLKMFQWQLEELRVSLFAQELKTPYPVSVKRLWKEWDSVK